MTYKVIQSGVSRSFPVDSDFLSAAREDGESAIVLGLNAGSAFTKLKSRSSYHVVAIELGTECLGVHTGDATGDEYPNVVGFARFRFGDCAPSKLIELVVQPTTSAETIQAAKAIFEAAGLVVAVCKDFPGRIVDRLVRPYYNAALRRLDEGLASASDMDTTLKLGLGYPEGPIALMERTGLEHHYDVSLALFSALGGEDYLPARRAQVAKQRAMQKP